MPKHDEHGQATVELAVAIPFVVFLVMLLGQIGIVMFDQLAVAQAAREGARAAAVDPHPGAAAAAARQATHLNGRNLSVTVGTRPAAGGLIHVSVQYRAQIMLPLTDQVLFSPELSGDAAMRVES